MNTDLKDKTVEMLLENLTSCETTYTQEQIFDELICRDREWKTLYLKALKKLSRERNSHPI